MEVQAAVRCLHHDLNHISHASPVAYSGGQMTEAAGVAAGASQNTEAMAAATRVQKFYRSYRARRQLADSAIVAELWWQALDYAMLNCSTVSFFDQLRPETAIGRLKRTRLNASKVGKGLSKDEKALKLAFQHWIEAIDPRHRYGHNLHVYFGEWIKSQAGQPFFYWLDIGDGRDIDLKECPRSLLLKQCIKYFGPQERQRFEYMPANGKIIHKQTGELLDTRIKELELEKWIFVMSTSKRLFASQKKKGMIHHSSFLAGGATMAAGKLTAANGILQSISAYSGHYRPKEENISNFLAFLTEQGVDLNQLQVSKKLEAEADLEKISTELIDTSCKHDDQPAEEEYNNRGEEEVETSEKMENKREKGSYWPNCCTGAGRRNGWISNFPSELRTQALKLVMHHP